ncbi:class II aaRS and biotin synthetase [Xylariaceae sp. FL0804]|nr:class II aaRS and biotin synthetase [Xylariaceae sp. FL0804]
MSARKLNVLVYNGTGTTVESVKHAIYSLRRLLSPNYAVIPIAEAVLLKEPWAPSCALLVFPGGADLGYCRVLNGPGNSVISQYVRRGGAYLGLCAGGYYGARNCEFEVGHPPMEVVGSRELAFFPGTCRGGAFRGFQYNSEGGARAVSVNVRREAFKEAGVLPEVFTSYYNGGGVFVAPGDAGDDVEVLASYADELDVDANAEKAALVYCRVGQGAAILTGPHPEFAAANLHPRRDIDGYDQLVARLREDDGNRVSFLKACLTKLGLEVNQESLGVPSLSRLHLSSLISSDVDLLLHSWEDIISREDGEEYIRAEQDTFHVEKPETRWSMAGLKDALLPRNDITGELTTAASSSPGNGDGTEAMIDYASVPKRIVAHQGAWPEAKDTPCFNHHAFYGSLREFRAAEPDAEEWGDYLMYGEVVTSTNTLLDRNHKLLAKLPSGFTLAATTQVAGRGRGTNVWLSPAGSLITSTVIHHPAHLAASRPIVFLQYLAAVAVVQAVKTYDRGGYDELPVKLKWPNDIYALDPRRDRNRDRSRQSASSPGDDNDDKAAWVKIGGILSNCAYAAGAYRVVLGIGLNTTNGRPTTSLDALLPPHLAPFRVERLAARVLTRLEALYAAFVRDGFAPRLERLYYEHWLHGRQIVTLNDNDDKGRAVRARIVGITSDWGMLRAEELATGRVWALQSDENSFDFFNGLIKRKI